jgi:hypothetical protein
MAYFEDLSPCPNPEVHPPITAVGWLDDEHPFPTAVPNEELLDLLWSYCRVAVVPTRGWHDCQFCPPRNRLLRVTRKGRLLHLGSAEICALSPTGEVYSAPNLVYHYVSAHHYAPPAVFVDAMRTGLPPTSDAYFARLTGLGLPWKIVEERSWWRVLLGRR